MPQYISCYKCNVNGATPNVCTCGDMPTIRNGLDVKFSQGDMVDVEQVEEYKIDNTTGWWERKCIGTNE